MLREFLSPEEEKYAFCCHRVLRKHFTHFHKSLFIQMTAARQVKVTDNGSRWNPQINGGTGDTLPTRSPFIGKNQCQADRAKLPPRCIFCDVRELYAFNDPYFALYQKQGTADYTERTLRLPFSAVSLLKEHVALRKCCICYLRRFYIEVRWELSKRTSKQTIGGEYQLCLSWIWEETAFQQDIILPYQQLCQEWEDVSIELLHFCCCSIKRVSSSECSRSWLETFLLK